MAYGIALQEEQGAINLTLKAILWPWISIFFLKMCFCVNIYEDMWAKEFLSALFREYWASKQMILS